MRRTVIPLNRGLYELLVDAARAGEPLSYNDVGRLLELSLDYPPHRNEMEQLLGVISRHEAASGRPLLTSIVLRKDEGSGGAGFFRLGQQLGMVLDREGAQAFSARQLKETIEFWQSPMAPSVDEAIGGPTRTAADLQAEEDQLRAEMELMDADRLHAQASAATADQLGVEAQAARAKVRRQAATTELPPSRGRAGRAAAQREAAPPPLVAPPAPAAPPPPAPAQALPQEYATRTVEEWPAEPGLEAKARAPRAEPATTRSAVEPVETESPEPEAVEPEPERVQAEPERVESEPEPAPISKQESAPVTEPVPEPTPAPSTEAAPPASPLVGNKAVENSAVRWVLQLERAAGRKPEDRRFDPDFPADIASPPRVIEVKAVGTSTRGSFLPLEVKDFDKAQQIPNYYIYVVENTSQGDPTEFTLKVLGGKSLHQLLARARERHYYELPWPASHYDTAPGMEGLSELET